MLRCYEPAHIAGVSKTAYVPATPRCLEWRRDLQRTSTNSAPSDPDSQDPCRRPARRHRGDRRGPRLPVAGVLVLDGVLALDGASPSATASRAALAASTVVRLARPTVPSPTARRSSTTRFRVWPTSIRRSSVPCAGPRPMPRTTASSSSSTAAGVPRRTRSDSSVRRSRSTAQKQEAARWVATPNTSAHVSGDAVDIGPSGAAAWLSAARRRVRAVPDLRQRALALRAAPGGHRSRLPAHVRRPDARSKDAAVTT